MEKKQKARSQLGGQAVASILNPARGYRDEMMRKGIRPKDHERLNRLVLKEIQNQNRQRLLEQAQPGKQLFKLSRFANVSSRVLDATAKKSEESARHEFLRKGEGGARPRSATSQRSQRSVRSPLQRPNSMSARTGAGSPSERHKKEPTPTLDELRRRDQELKFLMSKEPVNFIFGNAYEATKMRPPQPEAVLRERKHPNFGKVPEYLLRLKEQRALEEEERRKRDEDPDCPPGMVRMKEEERLNTLKALKDSLEEIRLQINKLPLRIETPGQIRRKNVLDAKLQEVEEAIRVFSRSKVYVTPEIDVDPAL